MGAMEITYDGINPNHTMIFIKGMGSRYESEARQVGSNINVLWTRLLISLLARRTNPVEQLYAAWPAFMYLNATYGRYILEPLLKYQFTASGSPNYAVKDLGTHTVMN
jgi:hypothetical protein